MPPTPSQDECYSNTHSLHNLIRNFTASSYACLDQGSVDTLSRSKTDVFLIVVAFDVDSLLSNNL